MEWKWFHSYKELCISLTYRTQNYFLKYYDLTHLYLWGTDQSKWCPEGGYRVKKEKCKWKLTLCPRSWKELQACVISDLCWTGFISHLRITCIVGLLNVKLMLDQFLELFNPFLKSWQFWLSSLYFPKADRQGPLVL